MERFEDIYDTPEFKALPRRKRILLRLWWSFLLTLHF